MIKGENPLAVRAHRDEFGDAERAGAHLYENQVGGGGGSYRIATRRSVSSSAESFKGGIAMPKLRGMGYYTRKKETAPIISSLRLPARESEDENTQQEEDEAFVYKEEATIDHQRDAEIFDTESPEPAPVLNNNSNVSTAGTSALFDHEVPKQLSPDQPSLASRFRRLVTGFATTEESNDFQVKNELCREVSLSNDDSLAGNSAEVQNDMFQVAEQENMLFRQGNNNNAAPAFGNFDHENHDGQHVENTNALFRRRHPDIVDSSEDYSFNNGEKGVAFRNSNFGSFRRHFSSSAKIPNDEASLKIGHEPTVRADASSTEALPLPQSGSTGGSHNYSDPRILTVHNNMRRQMHSEERSGSIATMNYPHSHNSMTSSTSREMTSVDKNSVPDNYGRFDYDSNSGATMVDGTNRMQRHIVNTHADDAHVVAHSVYKEKICQAGVNSMTHDRGPQSYTSSEVNYTLEDTVDGSNERQQAGEEQSTALVVNGFDYSNGDSSTIANRNITRNGRRGTDDYGGDFAYGDTKRGTLGQKNNRSSRLTHDENDIVLGNIHQSSDDSVVGGTNSMGNKDLDNDNADFEFYHKAEAEISGTSMKPKSSAGTSHQPQGISYTPQNNLDFASSKAGHFAGEALDVNTVVGFVNSCDINGGRKNESSDEQHDPSEGRIGFVGRAAAGILSILNPLGKHTQNESTASFDYPGGNEKEFDVLHRSGRDASDVEKETALGYDQKPPTSIFHARSVRGNEIESQPESFDIDLANGFLSGHHQGKLSIIPQSADCAVHDQPSQQFESVLMRTVAIALEAEADDDDDTPTGEISFVRGVHFGDGRSLEEIMCEVEAAGTIPEDDNLVPLEDGIVKSVLYEEDQEPDAEDLITDLWLMGLKDSDSGAPIHKDTDFDLWQMIGPINWWSRRDREKKEKELAKVEAQARAEKIALIVAEVTEALKVSDDEAQDEESSDGELSDDGDQEIDVLQLSSLPEPIEYELTSKEHHSPEVVRRKLDHRALIPPGLVETQHTSVNDPGLPPFRSVYRNHSDLHLIEEHVITSFDSAPALRKSSFDNSSGSGPSFQSAKSVPVQEVMNDNAIVKPENILTENAQKKSSIPSASLPLGTTVLQDLDECASPRHSSSRKTTTPVQARRPKSSTQTRGIESKSSALTTGSSIMSTPPRKVAPASMACQPTKTSAKSRRSVIQQSPIDSSGSTSDLLKWTASISLPKIKSVQILESDDGSDPTPMGNESSPPHAPQSVVSSSKVRDSVRHTPPHALRRNLLSQDAQFNSLAADSLSGRCKKSAAVDVDAVTKAEENQPISRKASSATRDEVDTASSDTTERAAEEIRPSKILHAVNRSDSRNASSDTTYQFDTASFDTTAERAAASDPPSRRSQAADHTKSRSIFASTTYDVATTSASFEKASAVVVPSLIAEGLNEASSRSSFADTICEVETASSDSAKTSPVDSASNISSPEPRDLVVESEEALRNSGTTTTVSLLGVSEDQDPNESQGALSLNLNINSLRPESPVFDGDSSPRQSILPERERLSSQWYPLVDPTMESSEALAPAAQKPKAKPSSSVKDRPMSSRWLKPLLAPVLRDYERMPTEKMAPLPHGSIMSLTEDNNIIEGLRDVQVRAGILEQSPCPLPCQEPSQIFIVVPTTVISLKKGTSCFDEDSDENEGTEMPYLKGIPIHHVQEILPNKYGFGDISSDDPHYLHLVSPIKVLSRGYSSSLHHFAAGPSAQLTFCVKDRLKLRLVSDYPRESKRMPIPEHPTIPSELSFVTKFPTALSKKKRRVSFKL